MSSTPVRVMDFAEAADSITVASTKQLAGTTVTQIWKHVSILRNQFETLLDKIDKDRQNKEG